MIDDLVSLIKKFENDKWNVEYKSFSYHTRAKKDRFIIEVYNNATEFELRFDGGSAYALLLAKFSNSELDFYLENIIPYLNLGNTAE